MPNTILVVDDQSNVRRLLQEYLTEQGFRVVTAADGQSAIYNARHEQPDLILLDIMMPKMDGYQFLRQFRKERQTPVIIITAREEETDAVLGLDLGNVEEGQAQVPVVLQGNVDQLLQARVAEHAAPADAGGGVAGHRCGGDAAIGIGYRQVRFVQFRRQGAGREGQGEADDGEAHD